MSLLSRYILFSALTLGALASSGCTALSSATGSATPINSELEQYLNTASSSAILLSNSPWGANAQVVADAPYFAASGHHCRSLQIELANGSGKQQIACNINNRWQFTRLLNSAQ